MKKYTTNEIDFAALDGGHQEYNVYFKQELMPIFNIDTANYLLKRGFRIYKIKSNRYEEGKAVFFFEKTPESMAARDEQIRKFKGEE